MQRILITFQCCNVMTIIIANNFNCLIIPLNIQKWREPVAVMYRGLGLPTTFNRQQLTPKRYMEKTYTTLQRKHCCYCHVVKSVQVFGTAVS